MGMFDTLVGVPESYDSQLKCWECEMTEYKLGDTVPPVGIATTYTVQLGGEKLAPMFVFIEELKITKIGAPDPLTGAPVFDKWGRYVGHGGTHLQRPAHPVEENPGDGAMMAPWTVQKPPAEPAVAAKATSSKQERKEPTVQIVTHQLRLRDRFGVHLKLPVDLTAVEAERIALWVRALPTDQGGRF